MSGIGEVEEHKSADELARCGHEMVLEGIGLAVLVGVRPWVEFVEVRHDEVVLHYWYTNGQWENGQSLLPPGTDARSTVNGYQKRRIWE